MCTQKWWTLAVGHDVHKKRCSEALDHPRTEAPPLPGSQPITVHFCTVSSVINILFLFRQWLDQMLTKQSKLDNILRKTLTILVLWMRNISAPFGDILMNWRIWNHLCSYILPLFLRFFLNTLYGTICLELQRKLCATFLSVFFAFDAARVILSFLKYLFSLMGA